MTQILKRFKTCKQIKSKTKQNMVDKNNEFYNRSILCLQNIGIKSFFTHNEWKSVVAEWFIRTLKNKTNM